MAYYNLTNLTGSENLLEITLAINRDLVSGAYGVFFLIGVWIIAFTSLKTRYFAKQSFATASFITMLMSFLFAALDLIPDILIFLPIVLTVIGIVSIIVSGE